MQNCIYKGFNKSFISRIIENNHSIQISLLKVSSIQKLLKISIKKIKPLI